MVADDDQATRDLMARTRQLRVAAGIPIGAMADKVGVTKSTISVWERHPGQVDIGRFPAGRGAARRWLAVLESLDQAAALCGHQWRAAPGAEAVPESVPIDLDGGAR